jgi:hypothetical protein
VKRAAKGGLTALADAQKDISGSGVQSTTDTLTVEQVATNYGLSTDQVEAFCREYNIPQHGDHYDIPAQMLGRLESWAEQKGFALNRGGT